MVHDAIDEGGGAGGVREDGGSIAKGEICREDDALLLVAAGDDLEQQVGVSGVEGEEADLVDDEQSDAGVVLEAALESTGRFLGGEVEQKLGGGDEEGTVPVDDGLMHDVLGHHGLAESLRRHENDVARVFDEVEAQRRLDEGAIDRKRPVVPVAA